MPERAAKSDERRLPIALLSMSVEGAEDRLIATFTLSAAPTRAGFHERARYCIFDVAGARLARKRIRIRLPRRENLEALTRFSRAVLEGANIDTELLPPPGPGRP